MLVASEGGARRRDFALAYDGLGARIPVPQQHRAVGRAGRDVAVRGDVALGAAQARHHSVVAVDDLHDFGCKQSAFFTFIILSFVT